MKPRLAGILVFSILILAKLWVAARSWQVSADSLVPISPSPEPLPGGGALTLQYNPARAQLDVAGEQAFPVQAAAFTINSTAIITAFADALPILTIGPGLPLRAYRASVPTKKGKRSYEHE